MRKHSSSFVISYHAFHLSQLVIIHHQPSLHRSSSSRAIARPRPCPPRPHPHPRNHHHRRENDHFQGAGRNLPRRGVGYALTLAAESLRVLQCTSSCIGRQLQWKAFSYCSQLAAAAAGNYSGKPWLIAANWQLQRPSAFIQSSCVGREHAVRRIRHCTHAGLL